MGCAYYGDKYHCNDKCPCYERCDVRKEEETYEYLLSEKFGVTE